MLKFNFKTKETVVGFNVGHHGGCAIIHNGKIVAISEERLNRRKYSEGYINSFFYCLKSLGISINDIDLLVSSSYHKNLPDHFQGDFKCLKLNSKKFITVDHHLSHAYGTYFISPFDQAIIIVVDGVGNNGDTESYYIAKGNNIKKVGGNNPGRSIYKGIGRAYEDFTNFCGWSAQEAGKTMGLASHGQEKYPGVNLYKINDNNQIESLLNGKYYHAGLKFIRERKLNFGQPLSGFKNKDAAFFVQDRTEKIIIELINRLYNKYKINNLCLAGGVFLNSIINRKILEETPIKNVFVPPCCDDTGQPIGNALFGYHHYFSHKKCFYLPTPYLGKKYSQGEIIDVLEKKQTKFILPYIVKSQNIEYKKSPNIAKETAKLLAKGKIIGWFQADSEIGPRALGHRSILCAPFPAKMKDIINKRVKHREFFRPFAPAILNEHREEYFDLNIESPFMLMVAKTNKKVLSKISAAIHVDKTARVQTVTRKNGIFYDLLKNFYKITGVPVLLNTSFNDTGEPIVETPKDAMIMFCKTPVDYLVLNDYLIWKK